MKTASFIKKLDDFKGNAALYLLSEPIRGHDHEDGQEVAWDWVAVSAIEPSILIGEAETLIFPSNSEGEIEDWQDLEGSYRGGTSHAVALEGAGYKMVDHSDEDTE